MYIIHLLALETECNVHIDNGQKLHFVFDKSYLLNANPRGDVSKNNGLKYPWRKKAKNKSLKMIQYYIFTKSISILGSFNENFEVCFEFFCIQCFQQNR
jgi:hypothetical protein